MRNLSEYPVTIGEIEECLLSLAKELECATPMRCGDMRPELLRAAAEIVVRAGPAATAVNET